ncbi:hypothetical protein N7463_007787 [Penicillium fimorum]|uniref:Uncharacterized protein n=1 Tax=Penicillium fimorum TaxID=1882269 RepID=A0A9W9XX16_9EURO|nr:hypothetical protein N7463_007787 [Penicillium fimorum]
MGRWRELLPALAALAPLSDAMEITSTFTTVFPTTSIVTSSSAVAGCTVAPSMQITCNNGYYNTYGAVWQETCTASYSGGTIILGSSALSLRACASACAVRPACSAALYGGNMCYLLQGDVTVTPGGPYQAAIRYAPTASPCVSTWLITETYTVTSTGEVVYTVTPSSTTSVTLTPTPTSVTSSLTPSGTSSSTSLIRPSTVASSTRSSPSPSPIRSSSSRLIPTSVISSISTGPSSVISSGSYIPIFTPSISSPSSSTASSVLSFSSSSSTIYLSAPSSIPSAGSSITSSVLSFSSTPSSSSSSSNSSSTGSSLGSPSTASSQSSLLLSTSPGSSVPSTSSGEPASGPNASATQPTASSTALVTTTVTPSRSSPSTQSSEQSSGGTPTTSTYTVTVTEVHTITSCAVAVTNCPAHQQTTYLTTETITYVTTVCPAGTQTTALHATGSATTIPHPSVIQTANPQHANPQHTTTQITSASSTQGTETDVPPLHMTTSTIYAMEIDVVTACPPSVQNCPVGQMSAYTTRKTVAVSTTTYLVMVTDSAQFPQSTNASVQPVSVPTVSLAHPHVPGHGPTGDTKYTTSHSPLSSAWKSAVASSGSTKAATHATTINMISGQTTSYDTSSPGSLFTGDAPKMGHFSTLFTGVTVMFTLFCF